jgi:ceramide glucosyltransferase
VTWLAAPALAAAAYSLLTIIAALRWRRVGRPSSGATPAISILKPVHGRDPRFYEAIRSHAVQDYPEFELLFGTRDPHDPALSDIERLAREFPNVAVRVFVVDTKAPNAKVGVLAALAKEARHPVLLVNDSDITVEPGYLHAVAPPLRHAGVGLVTALYRATADSTPARWEALGIATEFAPSVMVARLLGVAEFALGSTMAFRASDLERIGGFAAIENFLADDYQLALHISGLGLRVEFAPVVVETSLGAGSWGAVWRHQLRWSRTIRVSRPSGYYGYVVTHATLWALVALVAGDWEIGVAVLALRMIAGVLAGAVVLRDGAVLRLALLIPLRDLFGFAVWVSGLFGSTVDWRGQRLRLQKDGKIDRPPINADQRG